MKNKIKKSLWIIIGVFLFVHLNAKKINWEIKGDTLIRKTGSLFWIERPGFEGGGKPVPMKGILKIYPYKFKESEPINIIYTYEILEDCEVPLRNVLSVEKGYRKSGKLIESPKFHIVTKIDSVLDWEKSYRVWNVEKLKEEDIPVPSNKKQSDSLFHELRKKDLRKLFEEYTIYIKKWKKIEREYAVFKKGEIGKYHVITTLKRIPPHRTSLRTIWFGHFGIKFRWHDSLGYFYPEGYFKYYKPLYPEWCYRYNPNSWEFIKEGEGILGGKIAKENYEFYKKVKEFESSITDYEAMVLKRDFTLIFVSGVKTPVETLNFEGEIKGAKWLLEKGWLNKMRKGEKVKNEWLKKILKKGRYGDKIIKDYIDSSYLIKEEFRQDVAVTFEGYVHFYKHPYTKEFGVSEEKIDKILKSVEVRVRYYPYYGSFPVGISPPVWTDENGYFSVTIYVPYTSFASFKAHPIVYFHRSSDSTDFKVMDSIPSVSSWKDIHDARVLFYNGLGTGETKLWGFHGHDTVYSFEIFYGDTFGGVLPQPRTFGANIYFTILNSLSFISPSPDLKNLCIFWKPGLQGNTYFHKKSWGEKWIRLNGDVTDTTFGSDEWDDPVILHEFSHYLMDYYGEIPPDAGGPHAWYNAYPDRPGLAWSEGWAHFYSGRLREGSELDSLLINTLKGIGGDTSIYYNLENPWDFTESDTISFDASMYCEGAFAGVLWDIYDERNEFYWQSCPQQPDSMADSLFMGADEIWEIMDDYITYEGHHVYDFIDFDAGWEHPPSHPDSSYGHYLARWENIYPHHFKDIIMVPPITPPQLEGETQGDSVRLRWHPQLARQGAIEGYSVWRKSIWTNTFVRITDSLIKDTFYIDPDLEDGYTYEYAVTAIDTSGYESDFSNIVAFYIPPKLPSDYKYATGFNNSKRIVKLPTGEIFLAYVSKDTIFYTYSSDKGNSWAKPEKISEGLFPSLFLPSDSNLSCVFSKWVVQARGDIGSAQIYYTRSINNRWTTPYLLFKVDSIMGPISLKVPVPSCEIDIDDTVHLSWITGISKQYPHFFGVYYGNFYAIDTMPSLNYTFLDTLSVYEGSPPFVTSAIAVDTGVIHVVWHDVEVAPWNIRYRYRENGVWSPKPKVDTITPFGSYLPDLEFYNNKLHLVWEYTPDYVNHFIYYRSRIDTVWNDTIRVTGPYPFTDFSTPLNAGGIYTIWADGDVYYAKFTGTSWQIDTVCVTPQKSAYPSCIFYQGIDDTALYIAWTEGDSAPYKIEFKRIPVPGLFKGEIKENTTWERDLIITGDVVVSPKVRLKINPGVKILFLSNYDEKNYGKDPFKIEFIVKGKLIANGKKDYPIIFKSYGSKNSWYGIVFKESERLKVEGERLKAKILSDEFIPDVKEIEDEILKKKKCFIKMKNVIIGDAKRGIEIEDKNFMFLNSEVKNSSCGVYFKGKRIHKFLYLKNSKFSGCDTGIYLAGKNFSIIKKCEIKNNEIGVFVDENSFPFLFYGKNKIYSNSKYNLYNNTPYDINAKKNWWGTTNSDSISLFIYDFYDDSTKGIVYFEPIWVPGGSYANGGIQGYGSGIGIQESAFRIKNTIFRKFAEIELFLPEKSKFSLKIYDVTGRNIGELNKNVAPGIHRFKINSLKKGVYFLEVKFKEFERKFKIIKL